MFPMFQNGFWLEFQGTHVWVPDIDYGPDIDGDDADDISVERAEDEADCGYEYEY